jgi:hypothetical protein
MITAGSDDDKPPLFSSWRVWYVVIMAFLAVELLVFYFIATAFA